MQCKMSCSFYGGESVVIFLPARTSAPTSDGFHDCDIRIASPPCLHKRWFTPHGAVAMIWSSKSTGSSSGSLNTLGPRISLLGLKRRVEDTLNYSYFLITQLSALPTLSFLFFVRPRIYPASFRTAKPTLSTDLAPHQSQGHGRRSNLPDPYNWKSTEPTDHSHLPTHKLRAGRPWIA